MKRPEDELKELLLSAELDLLAQLRERCSHLENQVGDTAALSESVRRVIVEVLREAGQRDHDRMARVLAPLVLSSMREEIRNSRDMMVDALYPITGRLVAAAVKNAFRELLATINQKLDETVSVERWRIRLQAWATGRSEAEILLSRYPPFAIEELLVIHKPTGLLIARAGDEERADRVDSELVGGMLTAILTFVRDTMDRKGEAELSTLSFGEAELYLKTSPAVILALKTKGTPPAGFETALQELFVGFLERWGEALRDYDGEAREAENHELVVDLTAGLRDLEKAREGRSKRAPSRLGSAVLAALLLLLLVWGGNSLYQSWRGDQIEQTARATITAQPALRGFPLAVAYDGGGDRLEVEGLVPDKAALDALRLALGEALPEVPLEIALTPLPRSELDRLGGDLSGLDGALVSLTDRIAGLEQVVGRLDNSFASAMTSLDAEVEQVRDQTSSAAGQAQSLNQRIEQIFAALAGRLDTLDQRAQGLDGTLSEVRERTGKLEVLSQGLEGSLATAMTSLDDEVEQVRGQTAAASGQAQSLHQRIEQVFESLAVRLDQLDQRAALIEGRSATMEAKSGDFEQSIVALSESLDSKLGALDDKTGALATGLNSSLSNVSEGMSGRLGALDEKASKLENLAKKVESSVDGWSQSLLGRLERMEARLAYLESTGPSASEQLADWTTRNAIFFLDGKTLTDAAQAEAKLNQLTVLLQRTPGDLHVRVVGYADATGSQATNRRVSRSRAETVAKALRDRGIAEARLLTVGRATERTLSESRGVDIGNRRVEFELIFPGERISTHAGQ